MAPRRPHAFGLDVRIEQLECRRLLSGGPAKPTLDAQGVDEDTIRLTYSIADASPLQFEMRGPDDANFHVINSTQVSAVSPGVIHVNGLLPDEPYAFRARATLHGQVAYDVDGASTHWPGEAGAPAAPSNLQFDYDTGDGLILTWTDNSNDEVMFGISHERTGSSITWPGSGGANEDADATSHVLGGLPFNSEYRFRVYAFGPEGQRSLPSNEVTMEQPGPSAVATPTNLVAETVNGRLIVSWNHDLVNVAHFIVSSSAPGVDFPVDPTQTSIDLTDEFSPNGGPMTFIVTAHAALWDPLVENPMSGLSNTAEWNGGPPLAPAGVSTHLVDKDTVRVLWDNTPYNETGFKVQKKLSTDSAWTTVTTAGADKATADVDLGTDPLEYTKRWDFRVISMKGSVEGGISGTASQSGIKLQAVSFGGDQAILRDSGAGPYSGAEWLDTNLNGTINSTVTPYNNGTIDDASLTPPAANAPPHEHVYPVSYSRSTATSPSVVYAGPSLVFNGAASTDWRMKGTGGGLTFTADAVAAGGGYAWSSLASSALGQMIDSKKVTITWEMSTDGGENWFVVGMSTNHLYVTGVTAADFETVIDVGCRNAANKNPDTITGRDAIANAIFNDFADQTVKRVDNETLKYWGSASSVDYVNPFRQAENFSYAGLVKYADGRCGAWAGFLVATLGAQGVTATVSGVTPKFSSVISGGVNYTSVDGFQIYSALPAQGNVTVTFRFADHAVVKYGSTTIFDPSYGSSFSAASMAASEVAWEAASIEYCIYYVDANGNGVNDSNEDKLHITSAGLGYPAVVFTP